ncbi:multidrug efflux RND transporter permease subunit [Burkholderiaceae bacterium DAT-1]|nr:multidrug efflux RND transporter permease subunit [Burkholderiaceae bacterium DAT-1]
MSFSTTFIKRPVATTLLTAGAVLAGALAFMLMPVAPLPQVDAPTINVSARLPGASPETMATTVATPLERSLGRIAGITEMSSQSSLGSTNITLQFDISRDINGAARDVQSAINAARAMLPTGMPSNPNYRKVNPADSPIMILSLTSKTMTQGQRYDAASTILAQKLAQIEGIGSVIVGGSSLPGVRVELNPRQLSHYGIGMETVRTAIASFNANRPKGFVDADTHRWQIQANDQARKAADYLPLIISYKNGAAIRLQDVATVEDSIEDLRNTGMKDGEPAVLVMMFRQPGANIIATVDRVYAMLPQLRASIPAAIDLNVPMDRSPTIRASLRDVERTLVISVALVTLVVFLFLRNLRATAIPTIAVPVSLVATFGIMYLAGFSLNNLSLMALTIATGFVVDDAIVVMENIMRHVESGMKPFQAALRGAREVGFTVLSMSISLIAVFIPILGMGGFLGRMFREFAVTLSVAILISLVVSLTLTPMMCARMIKAAPPGESHGRLFRWSERGFDWLLSGYQRSLSWALAHSRVMLVILAATIGLNVYLYGLVPKGFFPTQDTGRIAGFIQADQSISFQAMSEKLSTLMRIVKSDPAVETVVGFTGGGQRNGGQMFVSLKPIEVRKASAEEIVNRLRKKLTHVPGAQLFLQPVQDIRLGGRQSNAAYQFTIQADSLAELREWSPKILKALQGVKLLTDVNTDQQEKGEQTTLVVDRDQIGRLGLTMAQIDAVLNNAFGQRQVSTIYNPLNQYHVVMEAAPAFWQSPEGLRDITLINAAGKQIPLSAIARWEPTKTALAVNHQGQFAATTISYGLPPGVSMSQAAAAIDEAMRTLNPPSTVRGSFQGTAKAFQDSLASMPLLVLAAIVAVYLVLGILYESYIHPITILSTLPSAGVGAVAALILCDHEFNIIAMIGVLLLIGIVKKNAIMMIDFALEAERTEGLSTRDAIFKACLLRFRPIMMTTLAAALGAVPMAIGTGNGAELRQPLGIAIVGGLILSQILTLYTTPVVYLYLDRFSHWWRTRILKQAAHTTQPALPENGHSL